MLIASSCKRHLELIRNLAHEVPIHLVGGAVRDLLLGRQLEDFDIVVAHDAIDLARRFARAVKGAFVMLDPQQDIARVVKDKTYIYDFAGYRSSDLSSDLSSRDFTINAIAAELSPFIDANRLILIDPLNGRNDLERGLIRMTAAKTFVDDPLRLLRAFRFAAAFNFAIEPGTADAIREHAHLLRKPAPERVKYELSRMLDSSDSAPHFNRMDEMGLVEVILPETTKLKSFDSNNTAWIAACRALSCVETLLVPSSSYWSLLGLENTPPHPRFAFIWLLKIAALFHAIGGASPGVDGSLSETVKQFGQLKTMTKRLRFSNEESFYLKTIIETYPLVRSWFYNWPAGDVPISEIYRLFQAAGSCAPSTLFLAIVVNESDTQGSSESAPIQYLELAQHVLAGISEEIEPRLARIDLITGDDLIALGFKPGPELGAILDAIREQVVIGAIDSRDEMLRRARALERDHTFFTRFRD